MRDWKKIIASIEPPKGMTLQEFVESALPKTVAIPELKQVEGIEAQLDNFISRYSIRELGASQVELTLPAGTSRIEFLNEAQQLSIELHASNPGKYQALCAVRPDRIKTWNSEEFFTKGTKKDLLLCIYGNVKGSTNLTREEQEAKGWNDVALQDLAVVHTAFYILTGRDLFDGNIVRAAGGALDFFSDGLAAAFADDDRYSNISASRSLSVPD